MVKRNLLAELNLKVLPKPLELKPVTRIVSHAFDMGSRKPKQTIKVDRSTVYILGIPSSDTPSYRAAMAAAEGE